MRKILYILIFLVAGTVALVLLRGKNGQNSASGVGEAATTAEEILNCGDGAKESDVSGQKQIAEENTTAPTAIEKTLNPEEFALSRFDDVTLARDPDMGTPHFIRRRTGFLSPSAPDARMEDVLGAFLKANGHEMTLAMSDLEGENAKITKDYVTRHNGTRHVRWQQTHDGLDIFGATLSLNLTKNNEIINVSSRALHIPCVRFHDTVKLNVDEALEVAKKELNREWTRMDANILNEDEENSNSKFTILNSQLTFYPLDMISAVKAWDMVVEVKRERTTDEPACADLSAVPTAQAGASAGRHGFTQMKKVAALPSEMRRFIIRADTSEVVEDINLTWGAVENASFNVYTGDSPMPITPGPGEPTNYVPPEVSRVMVTTGAFDVNASPQGWIPAGENRLVGNNANVYGDWNDDDQRDNPPINGNPYRVFDQLCDLTEFSTNYVAASQVQAFYIANMFHDRLWQLGFDEAAGNFQDDNFGRGGKDGDALTIEVQNGADNGYPADNKAWYQGWGDGGLAKVCVSVWSRNRPWLCGALDTQLMYHEFAHGVSTRLIGNGGGLTKIQARGLGEGWSDFFALALLSESGDTPDGCYPIATYAGVYKDEVGTHYYGVRRFPYSTDMSKAPQTLADIDPNQKSFPPEVPINPNFGLENTDADEVHVVGEIWCLALWECRANLIARHGFAGNEMMMQLVVDGMKLTPVNPTFTEARDAILQADLVNSGGFNQVDLWHGFAKRGLGYSAWMPDSYTTVGLIEAYDLPFGIQIDVVEIGGDGDGYIEPGESGEMILLLTSYEMTVSNIIATLSVESSNVTASVTNSVLPDIEPANTATSSVPFIFSVDPSFPGFTDAEFTVHIHSDKGVFDEPVAVRIGNPFDYPPEILGVAVSNITENTAMIGWQTGIPTGGYVEYGVTSSYELGVVQGTGGMSMSNGVALAGLTKGTVYHFRVHATGTNGLVSVTDDRTFRTESKIYVYANSPAAQELGTIDAPFKVLQDAAYQARSTGDEILVAMGTYISGQTEAVLDLDGSSWDLKITGGYAPTFTMCEPDVFETVLDGQRQRRGIRLDNGAKLEISGVTVTHGQSQWGGGVSVRKSEFSASDCVIADNASTNILNAFGGGVYAALGATVNICLSSIEGNLARNGGGIFAVSSGTSVYVERTHIHKNSSSIGGGSLRCELAAKSTFSGCVVSRNKTEYIGGGISIGPFSRSEVFNSTIVNNSVLATNVVDPDAQGGGGIAVAGPSSTGYMTLNNTIVYNNQSIMGNDVRCDRISKVDAAYCDIGDIYGTLNKSNHVISVDPKFANSDAGDFHLLEGSPCIDAGDPAYYGTGLDMDGEPRPFGVAVDIGADEFMDVDDDRMADYWEAREFGDILVSDGTPDWDNDILNDLEEYQYQTNPYNADSDGDMASDTWEVIYGFDPKDPDMDNDGMWDGWEAQNTLDAFTNDAALDPDGDDFPNLSEFGADTDPQDENSFLSLIGISRISDGTRLDWKGGHDVWQWIEYSTDMSTWSTLTGFPPPTPTTNAVVIFGEDEKRSVYRIRASRNSEL